MPSVLTKINLEELTAKSICWGILDYFYVQFYLPQMYYCNITSSVVTAQFIGTPQNLRGCGVQCIHIFFHI